MQRTLDIFDAFSGLVKTPVHTYTNKQEAGTKQKRLHKNAPEGTGMFLFYTVFFFGGG